MVRPAGLKTIGEVAELLAQVDRDRTAPYFARMLRGYVAQGVIQPETFYGEGRTAAAMFNAASICALRLMTTVARLGLSPDDMTAVYGCLRNMDIPGRQDMYEKGGSSAKNPGHGHPGLPYVIERTKAGDTWYFVLHLRSSEDADFAAEYAAEEGHADISRSVVFAGSFSKKPDFSNQLQSALTLVSLVLNCKTLFAELLTKIEA